MGIDEVHGALHDLMEVEREVEGIRADGGGRGWRVHAGSLKEHLEARAWYKDDEVNMGTQSITVKETQQVAPRDRFLPSHPPHPTLSIFHPIRRT